MRAAAPRVVAADKRGDCFPDGAERCEGHSLILSGWAVVRSGAAGGGSEEHRNDRCERKEEQK